MFKVYTGEEKRIFKSIQNKYSVVWPIFLKRKQTHLFKFFWR